MPRPVWALETGKRQACHQDEQRHSHDHSECPEADSGSEQAMPWASLPTTARTHMHVRLYQYYQFQQVSRYGRSDADSG